MKLFLILTLSILNTLCEREILQDVNTVLGIHIGLDMISWSLLNRDCEVLQWNCKHFERNRAGKNIHSLLQTVNIKIAKLQL